MCDAAFDRVQAAFGEQLKGVEQVDVQNTAASVVGIDGHLSQLRPAIQSYGGSVQVCVQSCMNCEVAAMQAPSTVFPLLCQLDIHCRRS